MIKKTVLFSIIIFLITFNVYSDEITLKTGETIECIILLESASDISYEIDYGRVVLKREKIEKIAKASYKENEKLREKWFAEKSTEKRKAKLLKRKAEIKAEARRKFEAKQKEKGLIKYKGEWYSKDALKQLIAEKKSFIEERTKAEEKGPRFKKIFASEKEHEKMEKDAGKKSKAVKYVEKKQWDEKTNTNHFIICYKKYKTRENKMTVGIVSKADSRYKQYIKEMGVDGYINWETKGTVYILDHDSSWKQLKTLAGPSDSTPYGFSIAKEREIFFDVWGDTGLSGLQQTSDIPVIFDAYELFNFFLADLIWKEFLDNRPVPLWLSIGTASYYSGVSMYNMERLKKDVRAKKYFKFNDLIKRKKYPRSEKDFRRFVMQSEILVDILINSYDDTQGNLAFCEFSRLLAGGKSFMEAFEEIYNEKFESVKDLSKQWYNALRGK